jgi:hypothetical protein
MRADRLVVGAPLLFVACVGQTGGNSVTFTAAAAGPADATAGQPLLWSTNGFEVALTEATLHVGAIYLDEAATVSGAQATGCYLTGTYVAQETSALDVDLLSPTSQPFPQPGLGITDPPPLVGQVWLTGGDVNQVADTTAILKIAGTATQGGASFPFTGAITIGAKRAPAGGETGGGNSICKQRIVTPIPVSLTLATTGGLLLRIDPRLFFTGVDFSQLPSDSAGGYVFRDDPAAPAYVPTGQALYSNLHSTAPYAFGWTNAF